MSKYEKYYTVIPEPDNFRYRVFPLAENNTMQVSFLMRILYKSGKIKFPAQGRFTGLSSSDCFKTAYKGNTKHVDYLSQFLAIDTVNNCAYFYDKDHLPAGSEIPHIRPSIINGEVDKYEVMTGVPVRPLTRITIEDTENRFLTLSLKPTHGYLTGINDLNLASVGTPYVISGRAKALNAILQNVYYVGVEPTLTAEIVISVDDNDDNIASVVSTAVSLSVTQSEIPSIPELIIPTEIPVIEMGKYNTFPAITVADEDGKAMSIKLTPFNCRLHGFSNIITPLEPGNMFEINNTAPDKINETIANLQIQPYTTNAQIGVVMEMGTTSVLKYMLFTVAAVEEDEAEDEVIIEVGTPDEVVTPLILNPTEDVVEEVLEEPVQEPSIQDISSDEEVVASELNDIIEK